MQLLYNLLHKFQHRCQSVYSTIHQNAGLSQPPTSVTQSESLSTSFISSGKEAVFSDITDFIKDNNSLTSAFVAVSPIFLRCTMLCLQGEH